MDKKVYFLGAGATVAVSLKAPLNENLLNTALNNSTHYPDVKSEIEDTKLFIDRIFHRNKSTKPRLEDILSFIDYNLRTKLITIRLYNYDGLIKVRNNIIKIICAVLKESLENLDSDVTDKFAENVNKEDVIVSTNYDIVIDNALARRRNINYGFRLRKNIFPVTWSDGTMRAGHSPMFEINRGDIKLLKIHGSLNWLYCPRCDEIDITVGEKGVAKYLGSEYRLCCSNENCTSEYEPLIVTPTKFKIYENRILKETWAMSKERISEANEIIFIGYSLPEADVEIRCLLLNGFNESTRKPKVTFVDQPKGSYAINNYKSLFGAVKYLPIGFIEYVNKIMAKN
ncbi:MAG: SIR2 family protein [Candidatus Omnitrophota bacterium]|jgi:hypothetical protein